MAAATTIQNVLRGSMNRLKRASDAPDIDAQRLLLHALGRDDNTWLITHGDKVLSAAVQEKFEGLLAQRMTGKPLAYILGHWGFYGREFIVTEDVLVPRPETENLVEAALKHIDALQRKVDRPLVVADVGTGSGVIAITLVLELGIRNCEVGALYATDVSEKVLAVARGNAQKHNVDTKIEFLQGDMLEPLQDKRVDLIVSNPPYLPAEASQRQTVGDRFVAKAGGDQDTIGLTFEPRIALDGGQDGQMFVKKIASSGIPAMIEGMGGEIITACLHL